MSCKFCYLSIYSNSQFGEVHLNSCKACNQVMLLYLMRPRTAIAEEFLPWTSRFPREYYQEIFRLYGWQYDPLSLKRTPFIGKFTNDFVYNEISPEVLEELRKKNPISENGRRKHKHHQHLTENIGIPHLERHLTKLITVMQLSDSLDDFKENFKRAFKKTNQLKLDLDIDK